jgi:hypothetical protein
VLIMSGFLSVCFLYLLRFFIIKETKCDIYSVDMVWEGEGLLYTVSYSSL